MNLIYTFLLLIPFLFIIFALVLFILGIIKIKQKRQTKFIRNGFIFIALGILVIFFQFIPSIFYNYNIGICNEYPSHWDFNVISVKKCECRGAIFRYEPAIDAGAKDICFGIITKTYQVSSF